MVFRWFCTVSVAFVILMSCSDPLKTKEKVQEAIVERVKSHSGLDPNSLDITTTEVQFDKGKATATVAFHPKGDALVNGGMTMKYILEERDGRWVVTGVNNGMGSSVGDHPPILPNAAGDGTLPAGHPSLPEPQKQ